MNPDTCSSCAAARSNGSNRGLSARRGRSTLELRGCVVTSFLTHSRCNAMAYDAGECQEAPSERKAAHQGGNEFLVRGLRRQRCGAVAVRLGREAVVEQLLVPALAVEPCWQGK